MVRQLPAQLQRQHPEQLPGKRLYHLFRPDVPDTGKQHRLHLLLQLLQRHRRREPGPDPEPAGHLRRTDHRRARQRRRKPYYGPTAGRPLHERKGAGGLHDAQDRPRTQRFLRPGSGLPGVFYGHPVAEEGGGADQSPLVQRHERFRELYAPASPGHHRGRQDRRRFGPPVQLGNSERLVHPFLGQPHVRYGHEPAGVRHRPGHQGGYDERGHATG